MPLEYYLGITVAVVIVVLLVSMMRGKRATRRGLDKNRDTDQLVRQLSRIADALETLLPYLKASPPQIVQSAPPQVVQPAPPQVVEPARPQVMESAPPPTSKEPNPSEERPSEKKPSEIIVPEPAGAQPVKSSEPRKQHVVLSMFGR